MDPARANKWNDITDASEIYVSSMRAFTIHTCAFSDLVKRSSPRSLQSAVTNLVPTSKGEGEKIKLSFIACEHQFGNRSFAFHGSRTRARSNEISRDKTRARANARYGWPEHSFVIGTICIPFLFLLLVIITFSGTRTKFRAN